MIPVQNKFLPIMMASMSVCAFEGKVLTKSRKRTTLSFWQKACFNCKNIA
jgi:hypothetical protein